MPADVGFHDIFGFDPDLLAMVGRGKLLRVGWWLKAPPRYNNAWKALHEDPRFKSAGFINRKLAPLHHGAPAGDRDPAAVSNHRQGKSSLERF